jgi:hypothetical protein
MHRQEESIAMKSLLRALGAVLVIVTAAHAHHNGHGHAGRYGATVDGFLLPNHRVTPGLVFTTDVHKIADPGYAAQARHLTMAEKKAVAAEYGYTGPDSAVEYDHLIPLELGGSNDLKNIWPQPIAQAHVKDRLEQYLHDQVVAGKIPIREAQHRIAANWVQYWIECGKP